MDNPLKALEPYNQFILYRIQPKKNKPEKLDKIPVNSKTLIDSDALDPAIWLTYAEAYNLAKIYGHPYGIGFAITANDPFWLLDIDDCLKDGEWTEISKSLCSYLAGCAVEVSVSGTGLHIIGSTNLDLSKHGTVNNAIGSQFYSQSRFVALTWTNATGDASFDSPNLAWVVDNYFKVKEYESDNNWTTGPVPDWAGYTEDDELIQAACNSKSTASAFGQGLSFRDLWEANETVLAERFPDGGGQGRAFDHSQADASLAQHLAFWTGNDCERIQRLMVQSALYRDKYDRTDYLPRTIERAVGMQKTWHKRSQTMPSSNSKSSEDPAVTYGSSFLSASDQLDYFKGCVYVRNRHAVYVPGGVLMKPDVFKAVYGGYIFAMDYRNEKCVANAWQAFIENRANHWPRVADTVFDPLKGPGEIVKKEQEEFVNIWEPIEVEKREGDPSIFLDHLKLLFPDDNDREIIVSYLAACVQHQGVKFQWCPLIQGVPGNGKTLLTRCVTAAIGTKYCYSPTAKEMTDKFNDWMYAKTFIGVEDIYVPEHKSEFIETLKPMITSERLEIQGKGDKKEMREVCANFLLNSNHKSGVQKTRDDRRFAPFYCPQQTKEDLARDGMTREYFRNIYGWLKNGGYAVVSNFLYTYPIPVEHNPANGDPAPHTSSTTAAIAAGLGAVEQEIIESIETDEIGFRRGWVSSIFLGRLLDRLRAGKIIPPSKRRETMQALGYDYHPGLDAGRAKTPVAPDNGKPRLYIKNGHISANLTDPKAIAEAYSAAQQGDDDRVSKIFAQNTHEMH